MASSLSTSARIMRDPDIIATDMDGETVMMSIEQGRYFGLSGVGPFLWNLLAEPMSVDELCTRVLQDYDVDEATCRTDVSTFVDELLDKGVLRHAD